MTHLFLRSVRSEFEGELSITEKYVSCAQNWVTYKYPPSIPQFKVGHRDRFVEMAFFHAFLAWEEFLEEAFTLYLLGKKPPRGRRLYSLVPLQTRSHARHMLLQGRQYVDWSPCFRIMNRNRDSFKNHDSTYFSSLKGIESHLDEISGVRNAIAHRSDSSWDTFKNIVRNKLRGAYPANLSVGSFLVTLLPGSSPPETVLDNYLEYLRYGAGLVVPS